MSVSFRCNQAAVFLLVGAVQTFDVSPLFAGASQQPVVFAPHRAVYDITLDRTSSGSGITDMNGRMIYELSGSSCDGYTQNMRFVTRSTSRQGGQQFNDISTSSWEAGGGERLRFSTTQYNGQRLKEESKGDAGRIGKKGPVAVTITKPLKNRVTFRAKTKFPMQHARKLIEAARSGASRLEVDLFDGSEKGEKVYTTNSVIGKEWKPGTKPIASSAKGVQRLAEIRSWPISIGYFEVNGRADDAVPVYELSMRYFDNGITGRLLIDYGDFALAGTLRELIFLEKSVCDQDIVK